MADEKGTISGIVKLDDTPRQADLYLVDLNACPTVASDPDTGAYIFSDPGDFSVIPDSDKLLVICHYGENVRPLAHGPVVPEFEVIDTGIPWTPEEIITLMWLSTSDQDTVITSGGKVIDWRDIKGGLLNGSQSLDVRRPIITSEQLNGLDIVRFPTVSNTDPDYLEVSNVPDITDFSIFAVTTPNGSATAPHFGYLRGTVDGFDKTAAPVLYAGADGSVGYRRKTPEFTIRDVSTGYTPGSSTEFIIAEFTRVGSTFFGGMNGYRGSVAADADVFSKLWIGARGIGSWANSFEGGFGEIILIKSAISDKDRRYIEGYLAHKWGLQDNLPTDHPYKLSAPVIDPLSLEDVWWEHVVLRLPFEGADGSTDFIDESNYELTVTPYSDAQIKTDHFKIGTSAAYFDGVGDYLSVSNVAGNFGNGDFCIEFWFKPLGASGVADRGLIGVSNDWNTAGQWIVDWYTDLVFTGYSNGVRGGLLAIELSYSEWQHIVFSRKGTTLSAYKNGALVSSKTIIANDVFGTGPTAPLVIGRHGWVTSPCAQGYFDDLRITKGYARYTADFVPPKRQLPIEAPEAVSDPEWANVVLLLPMNGADNGTVFNDVSLSPKTITRYGDTKTKTDQWRFGGSSAYFDGAYDYLRISATDQLNMGSGDFTVECWVFINAYATGGANYDMCIAEFMIPNYTMFYLNNTNGNLTIWDGTMGRNCGVAPPLKTWSHIAWCRSSGTAYMSIDGKIVYNSPNWTKVFGGAATNIGGVGSSRFFPGYIDDLRITKGVGRYTEDFTPPVRSFPNF